MSNNQLYFDPIAKAIASSDIEKMKAILVQAKKQIADHHKIVKATEQLEAAISKLEKGHK